MQRSLGRYRIGFLVPFLFAGVLLADDWPQWRGPRHDGLSTETGFKKDWVQPLKLVWERNVGSAFSSYACVGDRAYTCGTQNNQQVILCLNADTGAVIWQSVIEPEYPEPQGGDGTRATPTVNDGKVYIQGARGRLVCYEADSGTQVWEAPFTKPPQWGYSGSVLIEGDLAIVSAGSGEGALAAFNKSTGKAAWKCSDGPVGYATPYPFTFNNRRLIAGFSGNSALVADATTGTEIWTMSWKTDWNVNAASPIYHDGHLFFSSGYRHGSVLLKLSVEGDQFKADPVWQSLAVRNKFQSSVLLDGHLYTSDETGLKCVTFMSGEQKWFHRDIEDSTLVIADGHLVVLTEDGELLVAPATPTEFKPLTRANILSGRCWSVPVLYRGRIYARDLERLVCFDLTAKQG